MNGYYFGRVGAHEISHRLLNYVKELAGLYDSGGHSRKNGIYHGITSPRGIFNFDKPPEEVLDFSEQFSFLPEEMEVLKKCVFPTRNSRGY